MSFNLKNEILKLSSTIPSFKESDDEFDHDLTKAKVDFESKEFDEYIQQPNSNKRIRASIGTLEDLGKRYKGKKISRNQITENDSLIESDDINLYLSDDDEIKDEKDRFEEPVLSFLTDENENKAEKVLKKSKSLNAEEVEKKLEPYIMNSCLKGEIEKGNAIKGQLDFWEFLLETRVKLQNILSVVNQFPQYDIYSMAISSMKPDLKNNTEEVLKENKKTILKMLNHLIELQQLMFSTENETKYLVNSRNENKHLKSFSDNSDTEVEDDEIFSDTEEEIAENQYKKIKSVENLNDVNIKHFKQEIIEPHLQKINQDFIKYRNETIKKWYDKTRLSSGKSFESFEKHVLAQIEHIMQDKDRLIKRTQHKRSIYKIWGKDHKITQVLENKHVDDYDQEIFDDQDFYNQLIRELIDRKSRNIVDPIELTKKAIELQKLRTKNKKAVDTKASKGRKIKFNTHKPMVNFMVPIFKNKISEEGRNELFYSLFGNHVTILTSNNHANLKIKLKNETDIGFQDLFRKT